MWSPGGGLGTSRVSPHHPGRPPTTCPLEPSGPTVVERAMN